MPPRGRAPGLKRGRHNLPYWYARQVARDLMGFPDTCIPLPPDATEDELAELCQEHTARLRAHIARVVESDGSEPAATTARYDGTVRAACRIYQEHPYSPFRKVKFNTRETYVGNLKIIELTVGARLIRNLTVLDVQHWYDEWRKPVSVVEADGSVTVGPDRIVRAHGAVTRFRAVLSFLAALRHEDCKRLVGELAEYKFEKGGAREQEMTYQHVISFIRTALDLGHRGIMDPDRARSMATCVAAQFELMVRQKDILGEWAPAGATRRLPTGISTEALDGKVWAGFFTWEQIPGWRWRMRTSKSKFRAALDFDLTRYSLLMPLLEAVPHEARAGAIVKGERGLPMRRVSFAQWFRQIARAAGIPDDVRSMDARAGGATEADEAGVPLDVIQGALTHTNPDMTLRYIRRRSRKVADVADARKQRRATENDNGTS